MNKIKELQKIQNAIADRLKLLDKFNQLDGGDENIGLLARSEKALNYSVKEIKRLRKIADDKN